MNGAQDEEKMETILSIKNITKTYPGVIALNEVSLEFLRGEVHAIVGENGAGKSTLMKILSGAVTPDSGKFVYNGREFDKITPKISRDEGIELIYQEFNLVPALSVAENVFLGDFRGNPITVDFEYMREKTGSILTKMGANIDPRTLVRDLSIAQMQLVEIAKALIRDVKVLIMDEPTAPLTIHETEVLFSLIAALKKKGVTIVYISHRLSEIYEVSDRLTVMRDGCIVETRKTKDTTTTQLIRLMVGREMTETYPPKNALIGDNLLEVRGVSGLGVNDISFSVRSGEILGLAGLVGAGRTEIAKLIFGAEKMEAGQVIFEGKDIKINSPEEAVGNSIGLLPEDRKNHGLLLKLSISDNISLPIVKKISRFLVVNRKRERKLVKEHVHTLSIKTPSLEQKVKNLSGGNQQKVVVCKWLASRCRLLIFDEPTRGVDVGAKYEIYELMNQLTMQGIGIIMISSDMEELLGMADRVVVLHEGKIAGELCSRDVFTQEAVLNLASGNYMSN